MLSVYGDFQLTQDSLTLWLTDLDVILTNLEHLSEAPMNEKIQQLDVNFYSIYLLLIVVKISLGYES
jgi:hypothetical protein